MVVRDVFKNVVRDHEIAVLIRQRQIGQVHRLHRSPAGEVDRKVVTVGAPSGLDVWVGGYHQDPASSERIRGVACEEDRERPVALERVTSGAACILSPRRAEAHEQRDFEATRRASPRVAAMRQAPDDGSHTAGRSSDDCHELSVPAACRGPSTRARPGASRQPRRAGRRSRAAGRTTRSWSRGDAVMCRPASPAVGPCSRRGAGIPALHWRRSIRPLPAGRLASGHSRR